MKFKSLLLIAVAVISLTACNRNPGLDHGGAYAPGITNKTTNSAGEVTEQFVPSTAPEQVLFRTDAAYRFTYETALSVFEFEKENRAVISAVAPSVHPAFEEARKTAWDIDQRWASARKAYKSNPTPAGLDTMQTILQEIQRLLPSVQAELNPYLQSLAKPQE